MGIIQVRIDDELKQEAQSIYEQLGIDLSTAIRMFVKKSVMVRGIPFDMTVSNQAPKPEEPKEETVEVPVYEQPEEVADAFYEKIKEAVEEPEAEVMETVEAESYEPIVEEPVPSVEQIIEEEPALDIVTEAVEYIPETEPAAEPIIEAYEPTFSEIEDDDEGTNEISMDDLIEAMEAKQEQIKESEEMVVEALLGDEAMNESDSLLDTNFDEIFSIIEQARLDKESE